MTKRRVPLTVTEQERQFLDAFVQLLERDETARVEWLCALRAATRGTPYDIQPPAADQARVETAESSHPTLGSGDYLFSLLTGLRLAPPDYWVPVKNDLDLQTWLRDTGIAYRAGRYTDPFQPWEPRGRPPVTRYFKSTKEFIEKTGTARDRIRQRNDSVTQESMHAELRHMHNEIHAVGYASTMRAWCKRFGVSWSDVRDG